jgi:hypothetical protein
VGSELQIDGRVGTISLRQYRDTPAVQKPSHCLCRVIQIVVEKLNRFEILFLETARVTEAGRRRSEVSEFAISAVWAKQGPIRT